MRFDGKEEILVLKPGDWVDIPAHVRNREEWTDSKQKKVWLVVFYYSYEFRSRGSLSKRDQQQTEDVSDPVSARNPGSVRFEVGGVSSEIRNKGRCRCVQQAFSRTWTYDHEYVKYP